MPIEIRELHIKATVGATGTKEEQGGTSGSSNEQMDRTKLIAECVEKVLQILRDKKER